MAALSDLDTKRITISDLDTRLGLQTDRGNDFERSLADRRRELSEERATPCGTRPGAACRAGARGGARKTGSGASKANATRSPRRRRLSWSACRRFPATATRSCPPSTSMRRRSGPCRRNSTTPASVSPPSRRNGCRTALHAEAQRAENAELRRLIVEVADDVIRSAENEARASQERRKARG